jgi:hypothetical protein
LGFSDSTNFKIFCHLSLLCPPAFTSSFSKTFSYFSQSKSLSLSSFSLKNIKRINANNDRAQKIEFIPPKIISKNEEHSGQ